MSADHEARIRHLEQLMLVIKPRQEIARLLMSPLDVQARQDETVRRLQAAIREEV